MFEVIIEIVLALFAVFGFYAAIRFVIATFFCPAEMCILLEIHRAMSTEELKFLISRGRDCFFLRGNGKIVAIFDENLEVGQELLDMLKYYHIPYYYVPLQKR